MISLLWVSFGLCVTSIIELIRSLSSCGSGVGISFVRKFDVDVGEIKFGLRDVVVLCAACFWN
jgi:hypothetical protein